MKIFISYAHVDEAQVREVDDILRAYGHEPWFDHQLIAGRVWEDQLLEQIQLSDCFIYALTPKSALSEWCLWEFSQAVHSGKKILPVLMQPDVSFKGALTALAAIQYVDFCNLSKEIAVAKLLRGVSEADPIEPKKVPLLDSPSIAIAPERPADEKSGSRALAEQLYADAYALYKDEHFVRARALLDDCLSVEADHADAQKMLTLIERKLQWIVPETTPSILEETKQSDKQSVTIIKSPIFPQMYRSKPDSVEEILPPPFEWILIPYGIVELGVYTYGGGVGGKYFVEPFFIAKYPITNAQYQVFLNAADGYFKTQWWNYSEEAKRWRSQHPEATDTGVQGTLLPRTKVSWYDAIAFCRWLTHNVSKSIILPMEHQWQRAAQGDDERVYPWGNESAKTRSQAPTPVDSFPSRLSPYGVADMVGNVGQWCLNHMNSESIDLKGNGPRMIRGGSWSYRDISVLDRYGERPETESNELGFRIASSDDVSS